MQVFIGHVTFVTFQDGDIGMEKEIFTKHFVKINYVRNISIMVIPKLQKKFLSKRFKKNYWPDRDFKISEAMVYIVKTYKIFLSQSTDPI